MTAERVPGEQDHIDDENERADRDTKVGDAVVVFKPEAVKRVAAEDEDEDKREIEEITMGVLQDERQILLAEVTLARFADRTGDRIQPERLIISAAVIITGEAESGGNPHDQNRGREILPARPPRRQEAKN